MCIFIHSVWGTCFIEYISVYLPYSFSMGHEFYGIFVCIYTFRKKSYLILICICKVFGIKMIKGKPCFNLLDNIMFVVMKNKKQKHFFSFLFEDIHILCKKIIPEEHTIKPWVVLLYSRC